ncbi:hypothetical protein B0I35DRAFT_480411 [Stachybotrys elegans]|uniref:Uncharacterized protein n=1 Tax=Stachybotrys elegans TaxID=80388 RepID=A0A8K0SMC0_9HYPO|nr:hypothetical protein B0I35DRAFT_480411 [Stachybotrys elegans]
MDKFLRLLSAAGRLVALWAFLIYFVSAMGYFEPFPPPEITGDPGVLPAWATQPFHAYETDDYDMQLRRNYSSYHGQMCFVSHSGQPSKALYTVTKTHSPYMTPTLRPRDLLKAAEPPSFFHALNINIEQLVLADKRGSTEPLWPKEYVEFNKSVANLKQGAVFRWHTGDELPEYLTLLGLLRRILEILCEKDEAAECRSFSRPACLYHNQTGTEICEATS